MRPVRRPYSAFAAIWRWHFYAGLFTVPIVIIASATGAIYVFKHEFNHWYYADLLFVDPAGDVDSVFGPMTSHPHEAAARDGAGDVRAPASSPSVVPVERLLENVISYHGGGDTRCLGATVFRDPSRSVEFACIAEGSARYTYADQYSGEVLGHYDYEQSFMRQMEQLHRRLLYPRTWVAGDVLAAESFGRGAEIGASIVELATSWSIILTVTGLYLWWPRKREKVRGVWLPRVRGRSYTLWRDWHTVPSFYLFVLTLIILVTGLVFATFWGRGFNALTPEGSVPPAQSGLPVGRPRIALDEASRIAHQFPIHRASALRLILPGGIRDPIVVLAQDDDESELSVHYEIQIDQYSGEVLRQRPWAEYSMMRKIRVASRPIHFGWIYGMPTKILAALVCVWLVVASVSGVVMWWRRRPRGKTGFPRGKSNPVPPGWLIGLIVVLSVFMPTVGASLMVVLLADWAWIWLRRRTTGTSC